MNSLGTSPAPQIQPVQNFKGPSLLFSMKPLKNALTASNLLWCFAVCFVLKCKELRVMEHPRYNDYVRSDIKQKQLFEAAGTAVRERPDCPHSYLVAMHLYQDLQNATDHLAENRRRMRMQYEMARKGLECCQAGDKKTLLSLCVSHSPGVYISCAPVAIQTASCASATCASMPNWQKQQRRSASPT